MNVDSVVDEPVKGLYFPLVTVTSKVLHLMVYQTLKPSQKSILEAKTGLCFAMLNVLNVTQ